MTLTSFAEVVVTASGNIPGQTHDSIKRMVEECGARFEKLNVSDCTHLITTQRHVQNTTRKVYAVQKGTNCEVVSIEWLVDSMQNKHPVSTDSYRLKPATDNVPDSSQLTESSPDKPEGNKRKFEADTDMVDEPPKVRRNNMHVHRKQLIALVDDRYDTDGAEVALWMDEQDVRWDAMLISNLSQRPAMQVNSLTPRYKILMHRLQILYIFGSDKYYTWFRLVDNKTEEGELYGNGDLQSATCEFKRLFERQAYLPWEQRHHLPHGLPPRIPNNARCLFIQPLSEDEQQILAQGGEQAGVPTKIPEGVPGMLKLLFGNNNKLAIHYFFNEVVNCRIKSVSSSPLDEHTLQVAIAILDRLDLTLTESSKRRHTRNSPVELFRFRQASYLKECYFGLLAIANRSSSEPIATDLDWVRQELQNVHLLLKLRMAVNRAHLYYANLPMEVSQQTLQILGLAEIKRVRKDSLEYKGLFDYLELTVGSLHTVKFKEIINIFRIHRRGESERYHKWRAANTDKIGQRYLLWHGSGCERFIGILSQGLRVGLFEKSAKGMFGAGIYFADMSGKAARYCSGPFNLAFLLLCEVEVGNDPLVLQDCDRHAETTLRNEGKIGVVAHGRSNHQGWMNAKLIHRHLDGVRMPDVYRNRVHHGTKTLAYNEYVVYNPAQIQQRYLFHLKTG